MKRETTPITFVAAVPQFTVPDLVRTTEYYRDVLGFEIAGYWNGERVTIVDDGASVFAIVRRDDVQLFLNRGEGLDGRAHRANGTYDAYLAVRGIDLLASELRERGAEIIEGPEDRIYGQRELVVKDCNGLVLAFADDSSG